MFGGLLKGRRRAAPEGFFTAQPPFETQPTKAHHARAWAAKPTGVEPSKARLGRVAEGRFVRAAAGPLRRSRHTPRRTPAFVRTRFQSGRRRQTPSSASSA